MLSHATPYANALAYAGGQPIVPLLLVLSFALSGLIDLPRVIQAGSYTGLGAVSAIQLGMALLGLATARVYPRSLLWRFAPYGLFMAWMICRSTIDLAGQGGTQNGVVYALFGLQFLLAGTLAAHDPEGIVHVLRRGFQAIDVIGLGLIFISVVRVGLPENVEIDGDWLVGPRSVALLAIVPICWHLAGWCHGRRWAGVRALAWILTVIASLSRTGTGVAVIAAGLAVLAQAWVAPRRFMRQVPALAIGGAVLLGLILAYETTFYERFFEGFNAVQVGGLEISTSGRNLMWPVVIDSGMTHPVIGGGLGSSQAVLGRTDLTPHPHNDYLRVWHDGGFIALGLLLLAFVPWLVLLTKRWLRATRLADGHPEMSLAALLTLLGVMLAAITDNGLVYAYVMGISGAVIGAALGLPMLGRPQVYSR